MIVNSETSLQSAIGELREQYRVHRFVELQIKVGKKRSANQNDIGHAWYEQMAREDRQYDALGHKCYCKLHHGVPILRAEDEDFRSVYDGAIKGLTYEQKLAVMKVLPVTSLMTKAQKSKYLEAVRDDYATRGVQLQFPEAA